MMALGGALQRWGIPAHRLEARMSEVAERVGIEAQFFSTPTSLTAGFGPLPAQSVRLVRIHPGNVNLSKILDLDRIADEVAHGQLTPEDGLRQVRAVDERPPLHSSPVVVVSFVLVAAGACRLAGGGLTEVLSALGAGSVAGLLAVVLPRSTGAVRLFEVLAAFSVTMWVASLQRLGIEVSPYLVVLAGLIVLVPGLTLTTAASELATTNLVSGAARLTWAGMTFLQIAVGVALAQQLVRNGLGTTLVTHKPEALPGYTELIALAVIAVALTALFQAPARLFPGILLVTSIAVGGARLGSFVLSPELGASVGALCVTLVGNGYSRWFNRPALVLVVPGLLVLVPGSLGFESVNNLLAHNPDVGVSGLFNTAFVAVSLVAGLLVANLLLPPRTGRTSDAPL